MRRALLVGVLLLVGCGSSTPTSSGPSSTTLVVTAPTDTPEATVTPEPTVTPLPTPLPTLPTVGVGAFGQGWTLASSATNVGDAKGVRLRSTIGKTFYMAVILGESRRIRRSPAPVFGL